MHGKQPLIGVISDRRMLGRHPYHVVGEKYLHAVVRGAGGYPVALPVLGDGFDVLEAIGRLGGLLLTGSPSNVEPQRYQGRPATEGTLQDPARDAVALALIPAAVKMGLPVMAICRGFQEMNVAFGGTLHQALGQVPGLGRHRTESGLPVDEQYAPLHDVRFTPGGLLERISGKRSAVVNSVHSQGIDRLADALAVEALAPDGLVEAVTVRDAPGFNLAVQWHPEWQVEHDALSLAIFGAFGDATRRFLDPPPARRRPAFPGN